jgi:hypothetical protein
MCKSGVPYDGYESDAKAVNAFVLAETDPTPKRDASSEFDDAIKLAQRLLDEPNCDPDDDLRLLSRQLLRLHERSRFHG